MFEAALTLTMALALMANGKPAALRQALIDAARQQIRIVDVTPLTVCRMPVIQSDADVDAKFMVRPKPVPQPVKMPSVGKLLPCPVAGNR